MLLVLFILTSNLLNAQCTYFTKITSGGAGNMNIGIKNDGTLWAWGRNNSGQLGDNTTVSKFLPTQIGVATWADISTKGEHCLGIKTDGTLWAWGLNAFGQLGDNTVVDKLVPTQIGIATNWVSVGAGGDFSLAITADGKLWGWGNNAQGELGDNTFIAKQVPTQIGVAIWAKISCGTKHTLGIKPDGSLWAWGEGSYGRLGNGSNLNVGMPVQIGTATNWVSTTGGGQHSLGITGDGKLWAWGDNTYGQLGVITVQNTGIPIQIGTATNWVSVAGGATHSLGITSDGKAWAWGLNAFGQLGDNTTTDRLVPTQLGTATNWVSLSAGRLHSVGITSNGNHFAWGYNLFGQLGDNTTTDRLEPTQIGTSPTFTSLAGTNTSATMQQGIYTIYNSSCALIAAVNSNRASLTAITGIVTAKVWVEATQPADYVKRHYEITPAANATTATGRVTLYFTQQEFIDFNSVNIIKLPTGPSDAQGIANLVIEKRPGISSDGTGLPSTYSGTTVSINPTDADIIWNGGTSRWEVSFDVTGFSGFFAKATTVVLPVKWISVMGNVSASSNATIIWKVEEQNIAQYEIQKSTDGRSFSNIGAVTSKGNGQNDYSFIDAASLKGVAYYRIRQIDVDGRSSISAIVKLGGTNEKAVSVYPVPARTTVVVTVPQTLLATNAQLFDNIGRQIKTILLTNTTFTVDVNGLPNGVYVLSFANGSNTKLVKE